MLVTILPLYIVVDECSYHTSIRKLGELTAIVKEATKRNMKPLLQLLYSNSEQLVYNLVGDTMNN